MTFRDAGLNVEAQEEPRWGLTGRRHKPSAVRGELACMASVALRALPRLPPASGSPGSMPGDAVSRTGYRSLTARRGPIRQARIIGWPGSTSEVRRLPPSVTGQFAVMQGRW